MFAKPEPCNLLVSTLALLVGCAAATAQSTPAVNDFMAALNKNIAELATGSGADASGICNRMISRMVNIDAVATNALGDISARMSPRQRGAYRGAALRWAVRDCVRLNGDNRGRPLAFAGLRRGEAGALLLATRSDQPQHMIVWRLRGADRLEAVDVIVDGRSMSLALREETNALLSRTDNSIDMAIANLGR